MAAKRNIKQLSESEVIALAKEDQYYFGVLYNKYYDEIFRFVFKRLGGNESVAGDVTQETFIKAMANLDKYEDRGYPFSSWLYRISQNEVNMYFRKQKKNFEVPINEEQVIEVATEAGLPSEYMTTEQQEKLIEILNDLESDNLDLIELRFFEKLSFKQIAEIYNISEANAKMRTYRILERITKKWKADE